MAEVAVWSRILQFRSGPQSHTFYACKHKDCLKVLEDGDAGSGNFFATKKNVVEPVNPDDEIDCDFCTEPNDPE
jgi:hypothetical protein